MSQPPPGPQSPAIVQTIRYRAKPVHTLQAARRRYGPVFRMRFAGLPPQVFITSADLVEQLNAVETRTGEVRRQFLEPLVGHHSLLTLDGELWRRHRRLLSPPLHGRAVARWRDQIAEITAAEIATWPLGRPFRMRERTQRITLEVILRMVFGIREAGRLDRLRLLIPELLGSGEAVAMMPPKMTAWALESPVPRRLPWLPTTRFVRLRAAVHEILHAEIAQRRREPDPDATDVLSLLVAARDEEGEPLTDREVRDEMITLLLAGHETTATELAWAFDRLLHTPRTLERVRTEVAAGEEETYLDAVVEETLRCRPVLFNAVRLLDVPVEIGPYEIPAGWLVSPQLTLINRDPAVFSDPEAFRPERFIGPGADRANQAWSAFGGGRRYCVGAQLATLEMRVIVREVLRTVRLTPADPDPERPRMFAPTLVPAKLVRVIAHNS